MGNKADNTAKEQIVVGTPFQPGVSGNPNGRPKGSRNKLGEDFIKDLANHWKTHGVAALDACAKKSPSNYLRVVASLLPKEILVRDGNPLNEIISGLSPSELDQLLAAVRTIAGIGTTEGPPTIEGQSKRVHDDNDTGRTARISQSNSM